MTVRAVLFKDKKDSQGRYPIKIVVAIKDRRTYYATGKRVKEGDWNGKEVKKTIPGALALNQYLRKKVSEVERQITDIQLTDEPITVKTISRTIRNQTANDSFFPYANALVKDLKKKKFAPGTIVNYNKYLKKLKKHCKDFHFSDVDARFLRKLEGKLHEEGLANNTVHGCWKILKKIFNSARKDGVTTNYPFTSYDNPKYKQTERTFLLIEEVEKIEALLQKPIPDNIRVTIHYFLLGFTSGLRYSDWARFNPGFIQGDRLILGFQKNGEVRGIKMHDKLKSVVEKVLTLPPIYTEQKTNEYLKTIATMADIPKNITTHSGRHSYTAHCLRIGIPDNVIAHTMGITLKTLQIYKHLLDSSADAELQKWNG